MTETTASGTSAIAREPSWPRTLMIVAASIELLGTLSTLPLLFLEVPQLPGPPIGGTIFTIRLMIQPILALAALVLAIQRHMTYALFAFAALILVMWASVLPTVAEEGLQLSGYAGVHAIYEVIVMPLIAGAVMAMAPWRQRLATLLATLPTMLDLIGLVAFAISSAIFGD